MASTLENALRLVKPGEMVVSLTDILDKLGDKITADEKQQLLIAMLSPRREKVQPGDLISSDLLNVVLAEVTDLQMRVLKLESLGSYDQLSPVIFGYIPLPPFYPAQQITMLGKNFSTPAARNKVTIDGQTVQQYGTGTVGQLTFTAPSTLLVDDTERQVILRIENADGLFDTASVGVKKPAVIPTGAIKVAYKGPSVNTNVSAGGNYLLAFEVETATHPDALDYHLSVDSIWPAVIYESGATGNQNQLNLNLVSGQKKLLTISVTVPGTVGSTDTIQLTLNILQTTLGTNVPAWSQTLKLTIGQPLPSANDMVGVAIKSLPQETSMIGGRLVFGKPTDAVQPVRRTLLFLVDFSQNAEAGDYFLTCDADPHWTSSVTSTPMKLTNPLGGNASTIESSSCVIQADNGNAPDAILRFILSKDTSFSASFNLMVGVAK
ncbi:MAG: hypothetical protein PHI29_11990 [Gallionella sp.]|nr:hypothetical protein [Gallionella sp.]